MARAEPLMRVALTRDDVLDLVGVAYLAEAGLVAAQKTGVMPPGGFEASERMLTRFRERWSIPAAAPRTEAN